MSSGDEWVLLVSEGEGGRERGREGGREGERERERERGREGGREREREGGRERERERERERGGGEGGRERERADRVYIPLFSTASNIHTFSASSSSCSCVSEKVRHTQRECVR